MVHFKKYFNFKLLLLLILVISGLVSGVYFVNLYLSNSQSGSNQEKIKGTVIEAVTTSESNDGIQTYATQKLKVEISEDDSPKFVNVEYTSDSFARHPLKAADIIYLTKTKISDTETVYNFAHLYRLDRLLIVVFIFLVVVVLIAGKKGFGSILGLVVSIAVIFYYMMPQIVAGKDPLVITVIASMVIMTVTIYLAHGVSKQTTVALIATFMSLLLTLILSYLATKFTLLTGFGNEDAFDVGRVNDTRFDVRQMLIAGILITTLGALDDVTTAQSAAVFALAKMKKDFKFWELFKESYEVGREHVLALVNTLIIAYVGSSFVVFFSYFVFYRYEPILLLLNREMFAQEIVQTLAVSAGLMLSMPVVTLVASYVALNKSRSKK